jgi:hypothetical protein
LYFLNVSVILITIETKKCVFVKILLNFILKISKLA